VIGYDRQRVVVLMVGENRVFFWTMCGLGYDVFSVEFVARMRCYREV